MSTKLVHRGALALSAAALLLALSPSAWAGGCYICGNGSTPVCKDYCAYSGPDTFDNRHRCEAKGCRITGSSACPGTGNVKICQSPPAASPGTIVASTAVVRAESAPAR